MKIEVLDRAEDDLIDGFFFYEMQEEGVGAYFLDSLYSDIESLKLYAGIHRKVYRGYHRLLSKRFPVAIFIRWQATRHTFMPSWTAAVIRRASGAS